VEIRKRHSLFSGALALLTIGAIVSGCSSSAATPTAAPAAGNTAATSAAASAAPTFASGLLGQLQKAGKVTVGYANTQPMSYLDANGNLTGAAIEVARTAMGDLGVPKIDGTLLDFTGLIPALQAKQFDMIGAGMAIKPARCAQVAFTRPFLTNPWVFIYKTSSSTKFTDFASIHSAGAKLAGQSGASEVALAKAAGVSVVEFPDLASIEAGLKAGRGDVMMTVPANVTNVLAQLGSDWTKSPVFAPTDANGLPVYSVLAFQFRLGDDTTVEAVNAELEALHTSGKLLELVAPFGYTKDAVDLAFTFTAKQLCTAPAAAASPSK
jgi:polar amino acid transport system substrate-binding protein